jgi:hypothetical protein
MRCSLAAGVLLFTLGMALRPDQGLGPVMVWGALGLAAAVALVSTCLSLRAAQR